MTQALRETETVIFSPAIIQSQYWPPSPVAVGSVNTDQFH